MSKQVTTKADFAVDVETVYAMFTDAAYVKEKNIRTGGRNVVVDIQDNGNGATVTASRVLPADVPPFAKRFVGETIPVTQIDAWGSAESNGARTANMKVQFGKMPVTVKGKFHLKPTSSGSTCVVEVTIKAGMPFVGGKIESVVAERLQQAADKEEEIGADWLSRQ